MSYETALSEARDLVAASRDNELAPVPFRDDEVARVLDSLARSRSVLLVGAAGVGKTAVAYAVAHALAARGSGGLRQLSTADVMAGTKYIGEWQTKITAIADAAEMQDTTLYVSDVWNLTTVGKTSSDPSCLIDALRPRIESGEVRLLGEVTAALVRHMSRVPGFLKLFDVVDVAALSQDQADVVLAQAAERIALPMDAHTREALFALTGRFAPARPQPGPALNLLVQVHDYRAQKRGVGEDEPLTAGFVEKVFSIYSGLPRFVVSRTETKPARDIRAWFQDRIVGQDVAIDAVVEAIALFKAGLHDPARPLGTFLFVGPTGVGKTELARALATFLFGSEQRLLRFDLSEFKDYNSFELLVGNPQNSEQPARLVDPVRAQPFQVILLDELEKAHANIYDLLLPLLDEGTLTPPGGQPVNFRNTMIIATSNVGAQTADKAVGFGAQAVGSGRDDAIRGALEAAFRPEFLNRFQHIAVFHPLSKDQVRRVARHELKRILAREGIAARNLIVDIEDAALDLVIERGFDPRYGARALKREIQRQLVLPLAVTLMEQSVEAGAMLRVVVRDQKIRVRAVDTEASRAHKREREPVKVDGARKLTRDEIAVAVEAARRGVETLATAVDEPFLDIERGRLVELRREPEFWHDAEHAGLALRDLDRIALTLARLERLRGAGEELVRVVAAADRRRDVANAAGRLADLERNLARAHRELVVMARDGFADALVEIRPVEPGGRHARDRMLDVYRAWASSRSAELDWLREPREDDESILVAVQGNYAYGYLAREAGLHRFRLDKDVKSVASVRVAPWTAARTSVSLEAHRALKDTGQFGGAIRSRIECAGGLVLQNARTLSDNRDLAATVAPSWQRWQRGQRASAPPADIVRRYDAVPFQVRDAATGFVSGRPDALAPRLFHELLCLRLDG